MSNDGSDKPTNIWAIHNKIGPGLLYFNCQSATTMVRESVQGLTGTSICTTTINLRRRAPTGLRALYARTRIFSSHFAAEVLSTYIDTGKETVSRFWVMANGTAESNTLSITGNADKFNAEAAEILANEALRLPMSDAVPIYEQLLATFPTSAKYWKQYVEALMAVNNDEATRQVFSRCLLNCLQVPLWRCYIRFIRKINDMKGIEGQEETKKAYEFMLNYVGADIASGPVWMEYIAYLKSLPAQTTLEESQRMTTIRKTYQRAIIMPTHHVEQLWRDYENFENSVSRALERKKYVDEIDWNMLAIPPSGSSKLEACFTVCPSPPLPRSLPAPANVTRHTSTDHTSAPSPESHQRPHAPPPSSARDAYAPPSPITVALVLSAAPNFPLSVFTTLISWVPVIPSVNSDPANSTSVGNNDFGGNPQRIDSASSIKRIAFAYEQCLMYLYHYPDIWYDYATWHAKGGSRDSAIKVFQRALKALPDSEMLKYAYAELEESHGAAQAAKKVYESLVGDGVNATALSHIQFIRFLRRTEGVEAARRYFLDARKSPNCTYHVYVAYAMMAFCLDKDAKLAHNIFEAGLKRFMHEPSYILEYADFLCRLNDDRNIRALFERALSSLPPDESVEVWNRFTQFEQTYGDLASMLKVEQRRKEALCRTAENGESALENSLQDVISRYSFMDLWPCSSKDLDHLARQEWLSRNVNKKIENAVPANGATSGDRSISGIPNNPNISGKIVYPDVSRMMIYGPRQQTGPPAPGISGVPLPNGVTVNSGGTTAIDDILKVLPPSLATFVANLPAVEGPSPDVDFVISICLQSNITSSVSGKSGTPQQLQAGPAPSTSDVSGSSKFKQTRDRQPGKRKDSERQDDDDTSTVQSQPLPRDAFKMRQLQKARATSSRTGGSASYGSGFSGDFSGSSG
ncbi:hypothetical protein DH2020_023867 [Rehmannia glutinosa]|uniref:Suppressor of forked domain-containing protein n=1 Tax=Rehmannia glutinosa TaxID=99300 RepID=A0ABR0WB20_REHGL